MGQAWVNSHYVNQEMAENSGCRKARGTWQNHSCTPELAGPLEKLFQYSESTSIHLTRRKKCPGTSCSKKQHKSKLASYCFILIINKVMKVVFHSAIILHLLTSTLHTDAQFGFCQYFFDCRPYHSFDLTNRPKSC